MGDSIPAEVQGRNFAPLFFDEKAEIVRPTGALYIQNIDGEKAVSYTHLDVYKRQRPDGGPYDETPPRFIGSTPAAGALNNQRTKVSGKQPADPQ